MDPAAEDVMHHCSCFRFSGFRCAYRLPLPYAPCQNEPLEIYCITRDNLWPDSETIPHLGILNSDHHRPCWRLTPQATTTSLIMAPKPEPNQPPAPPVHGGGPEAHHHASNQPLKMMLAAVPWYGLLYVLVLLCALRGCVSLRRHLRHKSTTSPANLADAQQAAWRTSLPVVPFLKKWVIYAPLWVKRRSQRARWLGTLPTRLQAIVLAFFFLTNIGFLLDLDWEHSQRRPVRVQLMGRSGAAMTANVIPLILMAARNNPLERMLQISHDTHILLHRWIGKHRPQITGIHLSPSLTQP